MAAYGDIEFRGFLYQCDVIYFTGWAEHTLFHLVMFIRKSKTEFIEHLFPQVSVSVRS